MSKTAVLELEGRRFRPQGDDSTLELDWWISSRLDRAGLSEFSARRGESPEQLARRLVYTTLESGTIYEVLGGFLVPEGVRDEDWTPAMGIDTGAFLRKLRDPVAKAQVREVFLQLLIPFVRDGMLRLYGSLDSSGAPIPSRPRPRHWTPDLVRGLRSWGRWLSGFRIGWRRSTPAGR